MRNHKRSISRAFLIVLIFLTKTNATLFRYAVLASVHRRLTASLIVLFREAFTLLPQYY